MDEMMSSFVLVAMSRNHTDDEVQKYFIEIITAKESCLEECFEIIRIYRGSLYLKYQAFLYMSLHPN